MGRPRKPTAVLMAQGTFRPDRHQGRSQPILHGKPRCPGWLDAEARRAWKLIAASLPDGTLAAADGPVLTGCCVWWSLWRRYSDALDRGEGDSYKATLLMAICWKNCAAAMSKLGMTPVDRERLRIVPPPVDSKARFFTEK